MLFAKPFGKRCRSSLSEGIGMTTLTYDWAKMEQERNALLAAILETAVDAIIVIDERGLVQNVNPATERLFGYSAQQVLGQNVKMLMPSPYQEEHDGYLQNYLETGIPKIIGKGREVVGRRQDGTTFPMHLAVSEVNSGAKRLFAGIVRDISDLKAAEQQLTRMNEMLEERVRDATEKLRLAQAELVQKEKLATLGQVSGGITHEIRNPLNAVKTSAYYLLNAKNLTEEKTREHLERIDRQVNLIDNVVTALSDVARMMEPKLGAFDVRRFVLDAVSGVGMDHTVQVANQLPDDLPRVLVDADQIPMVFRNLVRNARDAMPDGGTITLSSSVEDGRLVVHVSDTGVGISEEHLDRITEPLYSTKARGMGLGLSITKAIVDKHGGQLEVRSEVGKGSTFSVVLQIAEQPSGERNPEEANYG